MLDAEFLESIASPVLRRFALYWAERGGSGLPRRADIDPADFVWLLGQVFLIDVIREPELDFRFRLFGSEMARVYGRDLTGSRLSELDDQDYTAALRPDYASVVATGRPLLRRGRLEWLDRSHIGYERLLLPLSADGRLIDVILGATVYDLPDLRRVGRSS
ncbi:PAS domain-containing protein [Tistlia consotensis]|uniref:PAS domain-containing protein n=1 Tax=Tistlia consotensis USBA 355 TaxID=560819 RepID=A0A1Y6B969_9PROT|nr:PAS domain-containing protein [Tistlia consotensis]SME97578.1 PAS domain-containing protein [Tistlia consotensis USBA 355]SNR56917.1 PAS domain-containing protein [Tistlia consotensis]